MIAHGNRYCAQREYAVPFSCFGVTDFANTLGGHYHFPQESTLLQLFRETTSTSLAGYPDVFDQPVLAKYGLQLRPLGNARWAVYTDHLVRYEIDLGGSDTRTASPA